MSSIPEYIAVASTLREVEREVKRFEAVQKKYRRLHQAVVDANAGKDEKQITPKQFNELKKIYKELLDCCRKTGEASVAAKNALEPIQSWQDLPEGEEGEQSRKKAKVSTSGYKEVALPLWLGSDTGHVPPPPLCGRVPIPAEARIVPGDLVAANINALKPKEAPIWILCRVERYTGQKQRNYLVSDVAPEEGATEKSFDLPRKAIVPLPKTVPKEWDSRTEFQPGDFVMALFPGTTSFYECTVKEGPSKTEDGAYLVQFDDDDDEKGDTPFRSIKPAHVVQSLRRAK